MALVNTDRIRTLLSVIVREFMAEAGLFGLYSYRVTASDDKKVSGEPIGVTVDGVRPLPNLTDIPLAPSIIGGTTKIKKGSVVGVMFLDGKRSAARIVTAELGATPDETVLEDATSIELKAPSVVLAEGVLGVARMTDTVLAGPFTGTITSASSKVKAG